MKKAQKFLLALALGLGIGFISTPAQAYYYWWGDGGYHRGYHHGYYYGGYKYRCRWVGGFWRYGYWHPARKVCAYVYR